MISLFLRNREVQRAFQQKPLNFCGKTTKNSRDFTRSRGTTTSLEQWVDNARTSDQEDARGQK